MSTTLAPPTRPRALPVAITTTLGLAAAAFVAYALAVGLDRDDSGRLETVLAMAVAGQLDRGPGSLYGPFSGENPTAIMHGPLYYRLAAATAWPLAAAGLDAIDAALVAGRLLGLLATLIVLGWAYRLATLDGEARRAGLWAACLGAACPVLTVLSATVRPDMVAVALQTTGLGLVLLAIHRRVPYEGPSARPDAILAAYACFALAFGVKQHDAVAAIVSSCLLLREVVARRIAPRPVLLAHGVGLAIVLAGFAAEQWVTGGRMLATVFGLAGGPFKEINYGGWPHVRLIGAETLKRTVGMIALATAALVVGRHRPARRLDAHLLLYLVAELVALVPLCLFNLGAADNYALQAVVLAAVLVGRFASRAVAEVPAPAWRLAPLLLGALLVLGREAQWVAVNLRARQRDRDDLRAMLADPEVARLSPGQTYFVEFPQHNRRFGNNALSHDEWLYTAFELADAAEPRESWLRSALADGPIRQVITPHEQINLPGVLPTLPEMGYGLVGRFGPYRVWRRADEPRLASRGPRR